MEKYYSWETLAAKARTTGILERPVVVASRLDQSISINRDRVFIKMDHTEQRGVSLKARELKILLAEMQRVKKMSTKPSTIS